MSIGSSPSAAKELVRVVGRFLEGGGDLAGGCIDAALVEGDDVPILGYWVDDAGVPVVQGCGQVHEEDDGDAGLGA